MRSRQYLRGRVHGRRLAELGYYDTSLDEAGRRARLVAAAAEFAGEGLDGFWRGAGEVDPARLPTNSAPAREPSLAAANRVPGPRRVRPSGAPRVVPIVAVLFAVLVCVGTLARPWRPAHLVVFAAAAAYAALNAWWLPRRAGARPQAAWVLATVAAFFGGLAALGLIGAALR